MDVLTTMWMIVADRFGYCSTGRKRMILLSLFAFVTLC